MKICSMFTRKQRKLQNDLTNAMDAVWFITSVIVVMMIILSNITSNVIKIMEAHAAMKVGDYNKVTKILSRKDGIIL